MIQNLRPLFEDPSAPSELRNFVALARSDGPSQVDLDRLAMRVGRAIGVSAGVLVATSVANATALSTPPAALGVAAQSGLAKLGVLGKLLASGSGKLLAVGLSAGIGLGVWTYARPQQPGYDARPRVARRAPAPVPVPPVVEPAPEPEATHQGSGQRTLAPAAQQPGTLGTPVPIVTPLAPEPVRATPARGAAGRSSSRRAPAAELAAPVNEELGPAEQPAPPPAAELPSELSLIQQAEAARHRGVQALQLLATHERLYPQGALAQEREVLAIELLLKIGKPDQARARAARFQRSHPSSAHLPRVRALLERADGE
jgi:hypothetical protein